MALLSLGCLVIGILATADAVTDVSRTDEVRVRDAWGERGAFTYAPLRDDGSALPMDEPGYFTSDAPRLLVRFAWTLDEPGAERVSAAAELALQVRGGAGRTAWTHTEALANATLAGSAADALALQGEIDLLALDARLRDAGRALDDAAWAFVATVRFASAPDAGHRSDASAWSMPLGYTPPLYTLPTEADAARAKDHTSREVVVHETPLGLAGLAARPHGAALTLLGIALAFATLRLRPAPSPPEVPLMSAPSLAPNDTTPAAIAELRARLDALARPRAPDPGATARLEPLLRELTSALAASDVARGEGARERTLHLAIEEARAGIADLLGDLSDRESERHQETTQRAAAVTDACRALEGKVAATEANILAQATRLESVIAEGADRAGERSRGGVARLCAELAGVREEVNRASLALAEMRAQPRAPVALDDTHARALLQAGESAAAVARRVSHLHERLDAHAATLERGLGEGFRAARQQIDELARSGAALQTVSDRVCEDLAEVEARLTRKLDAVRDALARVPAPEPVLAPLRETEERLRARLQDLPAETATRVADAIERLPAPERVDLAPLHDAMRETQAALASLPAPEPVAAPLRDTEARLRARMGELPAEVEARLVAKLDALPRELAARVLDALPAPAAHAPVKAPLDLAPFHESEARLRSRMGELPHEVEARLIGKLDALPREIAARIIDALPPPLPAPAQAPSPVVDMSAVHESEARLRARLHELPAEMAAHIASMIPSVPPVSFAPVRESEARLRERFDALAEETARAVGARLPEFPLDAIGARIDASAQAVVSRLEPALRELRADDELRAIIDAIHALPVPEQADLGPLARAIEELRAAHAAADARQERSLARERETDRAQRREELERIENAMREMHARLQDVPREAEERLARRLDALDVSAPLADLADRLAKAATAADVAKLAGTLEGTLADASRKAEDLSAMHLRAGMDTMAKLGAQLDASGSLAAERLLQSETRILVSLAQQQEEAGRAAGSLQGDVRAFAGRFDELRTQAATFDAAWRARFGAVENTLMAAAEQAEETHAKLDAAHEATLARIDAARAAAVADLAREIAALGASQAAREQDARSWHEERADRVDGGLARAADGALSMTDALDDLRAESDARHRRVESLLAASQDATTRALAAALDELRAAGEQGRAGDEARADALQQRVDKLARDLANGQRALQAEFTGSTETGAERLDARLATFERALASREQEMERRWGSRLAALEARVLDELRAQAAARAHPPAHAVRARPEARPETDPRAALDATLDPRPRRRAAREGTE